MSSFVRRLAYAIIWGGLVIILIWKGGWLSNENPARSPQGVRSSSGESGLRGHPERNQKEEGLQIEGAASKVQKQLPGSAIVPFRVALRFLPVRPSNSLARNAFLVSQMIPLEQEELSRLEIVLQKAHSNLQKVERPYSNVAVKDSINLVRKEFIAVLGFRRGLIATLLSVPSEWAAKDAELSSLLE